MVILLPPMCFFSAFFFFLNSLRGRKARGFITLGRENLSAAVVDTIWVAMFFFLFKKKKLGKLIFVAIKISTY